MKRIALSSVSLLAAAAVVAALVWLARSSRPESSSVALAAASHDGTTAFYAFDYRAATRITMPGQAESLPSRLLLAGELAVVDRGVDRGMRLVGIRFEDLRHSEHVVGETDLGATGDTLIGHEVIAELGITGGVERLHFAPGAPPQFRAVARTVIPDIQVVVMPGRRVWKTDESTDRGVARASYRVTAGGGDTSHLRKQREQYQLQLGGQASPTSSEYEIAIASGRLESLVGREVGESSGRVGQPSLAWDLEISMSLDRVGQEQIAAVDLSGYDSLVPGVAEVSAAAERNALVSQVDGLTRQQLFDTLLTFGNAGTVPDHRRWIFRAVGLLRLDPELSGELVDLFTDPQLSSVGRGLLLDLLIGAGSPEAQEAFCEILASDEASSDPRYGYFLSRASLLAAPTAETATLVARVYRQSTGEERRFAAYTLGSVAGKLGREEEELAGELRRRLVVDMSAAADPIERAHLLRSLGNAGFPESVAEIVAHRDAALPEVRGAVATALRKIQSPASEAALLGLLTDSDYQVQHQAIASLARYQLGTEQLAAVRDRVLDGRVSPRSYAQLVSFLVPHLAEHSDLVTAIFDHIKADPGIVDPAIRARIADLLAARDLSS